MKEPSAPVQAAWHEQFLPGAVRFARAARDVEQVQRVLLKSMLARSADTAYGRRHAFTRALGAECYRDSVPLATYEDLQPFVDDIANGVPAVLTRDVPTHLVPTSGSTGRNKLIPFTHGLRAQFQAALQPWLWSLFGAHPAALGGSAYWSISPAIPPRRTPGGIPVGFPDDTAYFPASSRRLLQRVLAVPPQVALVPDMDSFRHVTLVFLLAAADLSFVSVWNPTFLSLLLDALDATAPALVADLAAGRLSCELPPGLREVLEPRLSPRPTRARSVERALEGEGRERLSRIWPRLALVSCWMDGSAQGPAEHLRDRLPHVALAPKGLLATEGVVTVPLAHGPVLAAASHFFELLLDDGSTRFAWELEPGMEGEVVLTTAGGLYRYRLGDRVHVGGADAGPPVIRFLGRARTSDLRGEKVHEALARETIEAATEGLPCLPPFALLAPREEPPGYVLYLALDLCPSGLSPAAMEQLGEARLLENVHYRHCRRLGQLQPLRVVLLPGGPAEASRWYEAEMLGRGVKAGDIKPPCLDACTHWDEVLRTHRPLPP